ncbi:MAG TPA: T9SS type A sorting domain-containing protein, partial [Chitinophagales bacterium]|nr:T9SS type A sorting domain-containing protein [Chitinophagales bacterium]
STYAGSTWNGSLQNMQPGRGYKLRSGTTGNILVEPRSVPAWNPDIFGNEFNMNVTAVVKANGTELIGNFIVGAFINGNCVGVSAPQYAGGSPRVFLTLHGDVADNNLNIQFLIYDYNTDSIYTPTHTSLAFTTDAQEGTIENAYPLNLETPLTIRTVARDADFVLHQNVPNPFNGNTMIRVDMPREEQVTLQIFDYTGKLIAQPVNSKLSQGTHTLQFNPENLAPGIYFYRMQAGEFTATRRMVIQ